MLDIFGYTGIHLDDAYIKISRNFWLDDCTVDLKFRIEGACYESDIPKSKFKEAAISAEKKLASLGFDAVDISRYEDSYHGGSIAPAYDVVMLMTVTDLKV